MCTFGARSNYLQSILARISEVARILRWISEFRDFHCKSQHAFSNEPMITNLNRRRYIREWTVQKRIILNPITPIIIGYRRKIKVPKRKNRATLLFQYRLTCSSLLVSLFCKCDCLRPCESQECFALVSQHAGTRHGHSSRDRIFELTSGEAGRSHLEKPCLGYRFRFKI